MIYSVSYMRTLIPQFHCDGTSMHLDTALK